MIVWPKPEGIPRNKSSFLGSARNVLVLAARIASFGRPADFPAKFHGIRIKLTHIPLIQFRKRVAVKRFWPLAVICLCTLSDFGEEKSPDLAGVTERGRALFAYDEAASRGTDAFFSLKPDTRGLAHYICIKTSAGWTVSFPKWNATHDRLMVVYEAKETGGKFVALKFDKPSAAKEDLLGKERALELATADFGKPVRPYNSAILPAPGGNLYVYLYPGQIKADVFPIGGDVRYTVSADGQHIIEKHQLHKTLMDLEVKPNQHAGFHMDDLSDVPQETDVLYVLNRRPSIPEFITTKKQLFTITKDGSIEMGQNQENAPKK
jgi:hypothetical protein